MRHTSRKVCNSWYHHIWFRILMVIVGVDMIVLGACLVANIDIIPFLRSIGLSVRVFFGIAYILVALFVIHYAMSYGRMKRESHFVCQHCAKQKSY